MDYDYIKNHYRLIAVDLSGQKDLNGDPNAVHQIEFVGQLKNIDGVNADGFFDDFRKNKRNKTKSLSMKCKSLIRIMKRQQLN